MTKINAIEIDSNNPYVKKHKTLYADLTPSDIGAIEIQLTEDSGTLTSEQLELITDETKTVVFNVNGKLYYLFNKNTSLTYRTFINFDISLSTELECSAVYVQLDKTAVNYGAYTVQEVSFPTE